jgi:hypothetical protein
VDELTLEEHAAMSRYMRKAGRRGT